MALDCCVAHSVPIASQPFQGRVFHASREEADQDSRDPYLNLDGISSRNHEVTRSQGLILHQHLQHRQ